MSNLIKHPYHLVEMSPWPFFMAISAMGLTTGMVVCFHLKVILLFMLSLTLILVIMQQWWRDISREGTFQGAHTLVVETGLRWGMVLFISSEVMFFFSFFWAFFHSSLSPSIELGCVWPPMGVVAFNPFGVPLMNTIILLSSGVSVTWTHHSMILNNYSSALESLMITIILGMYFTGVQLLEYLESSFSISDSVFGSTFFVATGFHGLHVMIGSLFLMATCLRMLMGSMSPAHHFGFEAAAWYWHFVDVVWLFLFISIYWWGGKM